ncbi:MAG: flagellar basal body L-ring protein FlgH [bacterium]|nr:flagellar basal body L-ring protein FlgH [bacterium]
MKNQTNNRTKNQSNKSPKEHNISPLYGFVLFLAGMLFLMPGTFLSAQNSGKKASLWRDNSFVSKMYSDPVARAINDIVTIQVSESSTATNSAELTTSKKTSVSMGIDNLLGLETDLGSKISPNFSNSSMLGSSTDNSNAGKGESTRESTLTAYITARVIDVMSNGNLVIEAKKEVMVNKEKQVAVLTGIIRTRDISYANVVQSNKVADMQIRFSGKGPVSSKTKRGWLSWLIDVVWPF